MHRSIAVYLLLFFAALLCRVITIGGASAHHKPRMFPGIRAAILVRTDVQRPIWTFKTADRQWKAEVLPDLTVTVKNGDKVPLSTFKPGEQVVLLSYYRGFPQINVVADRKSYAAFLRYDHYEGTIKRLDADGKRMVLSAIGNPLAQPQSDLPTFDQTFALTSYMQYWLGGKQVTKQEAISWLSQGMKINVVFNTTAFRNRSSNPSGPAYALFDRQSWEAYAASEIKHSKSMFRSSSPRAAIKTFD